MIKINTESGTECEKKPQENILYKFACRSWDRKVLIHLKLISVNFLSKKINMTTDNWSDNSHFSDLLMNKRSFTEELDSAER